MPAVAPLAGSRKIFNDIIEPIGVVARTAARALGAVIRQAVVFPNSSAAARSAHVAEPEQTRDQLGIKRTVTGVQQVKPQ
jgi:hypothetical protein